MRNRKLLRLKDYDYSQPGAYFITICTKNREQLFGEIIEDKMIINEYGKTVQRVWNDLSLENKNIETDEFIIMPNHIHGIIMVRAIHESPVQNESPVQQRRKMLIPLIVGRFKMLSAKQINLIRQTQGTPVWHRNYYEHIIRNDKDLNRIREYIINNPLKWAMDENNVSPVKHTGDTGDKLSCNGDM